MKAQYVLYIKYALGLVFFSVFFVFADTAYCLSADESGSAHNIRDKSTSGEWADSDFRWVENADSSIRIIGLSTNYTTSESGYGPGVDMKVSIERDNRLLGAGIIMQHRQANVYGGEVFYRHYLSSLHSNDNSGYMQYRTVRFYLQYNFIFRKKTVEKSYESIQSPEIADDIGKVATFEHYVGGGVQARMIGNFFVNADIGYGIILGSVAGKYNNEPHYTMGGRKNDYGMVINFGTGYFFGK